MAKQRVIQTATRVVTLGQYVRAVKLAKSKPDVEFSEGLTCWCPCTGREIVAQFMRGVHDRINQGVRYVERGM